MLYQFSIESDDEWSEVEREAMTRAAADAIARKATALGLHGDMVISYIEEVEFEVDFSVDFDVDGRTIN